MMSLPLHEKTPGAHGLAVTWGEGAAETAKAKATKVRRENCILAVVDKVFDDDFVEVVWSETGSMI